MTVLKLMFPEETKADLWVGLAIGPNLASIYNIYIYISKTVVVKEEAYSSSSLTTSLFTILLSDISLFLVV